MDARAAIEHAKARGDRAFFERALDESRGVKSLLQTLEQLGRLPADFDATPLMRLARHPHDEVRTAAVKALARLENLALLPFYRERLAQEQATLVRRELASAIGRLRAPEAIPTLVELLHDPDPKVVLQAIRGLLCFDGLAAVQDALRELATHPNELVRHAVQRALAPWQLTHSTRGIPVGVGVAGNTALLVQGRLGV
jgi:HEAT repeat protein